MNYPRTCTCNCWPCHCREEYDDSELATCPDCGVKAPWPDSWNVMGMSIDVDNDGEILEAECEDDGRVFCPHCGEIVVPIQPTQEAEVKQQTMFGGE